MTAFFEQFFICLRGQSGHFNHMELKMVKQMLRQALSFYVTVSGDEIEMVSQNAVLNFYKSGDVFVEAGDPVVRWALWLGAFFVLIV